MGAWSAAELVVSLEALASMRLSKEDTQVRTYGGGTGGACVLGLWGPCALGFTDATDPMRALSARALQKKSQRGFIETPSSCVLRAWAQGVRLTTAGGIPTPAEFADALLATLGIHLRSLPMDSLSGVSSSLASLGHVPPVDWSNAFLDCCKAGLDGAGVPTLVQLLSSLPAVAGQGSGSGTSGSKDVVSDFLAVCIGKVRGG